jgi:hypothetical protein
MNRTHPDLNIRYAVGVGDLIASILHSKALSWLVKLFVGKNEICIKCSNRRKALNILFPIKFWKLWFKSDIEYLENLAEFYRKCDFNAIVNYENKYVAVTRGDQPLDKNTINEQNKPTDMVDGYIIVNENDVVLGDFLIKTIYYRKK